MSTENSESLLDLADDCAILRARINIFGQKLLDTTVSTFRSESVYRDMLIKIDAIKTRLYEIELELGGA